jgi:hypothetical protein
MITFGAAAEVVSADAPTTGEQVSKAISMIKTVNILFCYFKLCCPHFALQNYKKKMTYTIVYATFRYFLLFFV